ncbi:MAG: hypothetical protein ACK6BC_06295 [Cyanobacteriota bacterium]|jgi:type IV pilus assembly protein PilO
MINLQLARAQRSGQVTQANLKRLWLWAPIVAGGALSAVFLLAVALPQGLEIRRVLEHVQSLQQQRQEIELLKLQVLKTQADRKQAIRQGEQLVRLVTGKGDLATFLATMDLEAIQAGVQLRLFEPVPAAGAPARPGSPQPPSVAPTAPPPAAAGGPPPAPGGQQPPAADALGKAGLREKTLMLVARGTYPQLLDFLRRMELLDVLVEQKDLTLAVAEAKPGMPDNELPPVVPIVEVKLSLTLWSKEAKEDRKPEPEPETPIPPPPPPPAPSG